MAALNPSVSEFIANFQGGGARPNLYEVALTFPAGIGSPLDSRKASFTCKAASLPSSNTGLATVPYMGRQVKMAGDKIFDDWTIQIVNDTDFAVRDAFERWADAISGHQSNTAAAGFGNPSRYYADATVTQLDREHRAIKSYTFEAIFPLNVSEITLGYDNNDIVEEFSVLFAVNYWSARTTT